jgi:hypothetical protein
VTVPDAPITTSVGQDLYGALEPLAFADEQHGWALAHYLDALGLILEDTADLVRADADGNDGWSAFADPARCPEDYLHTLAQWAGVRYANRYSNDDLRTLITGRGSGLWRGTKSALLAAVRRYMTPGGALYFEERADGDAYKVRIFTYGYDTLDEAAIRAELLLSLPAGLILDYELRVGQTYGMMRDRVATYADAKAAYPTYADMTTAPPTGGLRHAQ